jgi:hypothetical protein
VLENDVGYVQVPEDILLNPALAARTTAHELGHAIGISHLVGTGGVMDDAAYQVPNVIVCPAERILAQEFGRLSSVDSGGAPGLSAATSTACRTWNDAAGHLILLPS